MTNEWGPPLTGEEMKALKGRIDPETLVNLEGWRAGLPYKAWDFYPGWYHLPADHPYYAVREYNAKHGTNLVLHDGSAKVPEDYAGGLVLYQEGDVNRNSESYHLNWAEIIAYTPKPKESEMPSNEAIEYVLRGVGPLSPGDATSWSVEEVKNADKVGLNYGRAVILAARLIQQYEPDRLKPAVDVAAEAYATSEGMFSPDHYQAFKAGAAWQRGQANNY